MDSHLSSPVPETGSEKSTLNEIPINVESATSEQSRRVCQKNQPPPDTHGQPGLVEWEIGDPANPRNWSTLYKIWLTFQLSMLALSASLGSSVISPADDTIAKAMGVSDEATILCISLYMYVSPKPQMLLQNNGEI